MKLPIFIRKYLIKKIKMRVYKEIRSYGDYQEATSFVINAPLSEWRIRLWCVTHFRDQYGTGYEGDWQKLHKWLKETN